MTDTSSVTTDEPIGAVVHRLSEQVPELVRSEVRLAQAELTQKGKAAGLGLAGFGAAGLLALYGLGAFLAAGIAALALVLPVWAAALIVGGAVFLVAGALALFGKKEIAQATPATPERAVAGVKEDVATLKGAHR
ncbi:phage holin family protein [Nocardioides lianchengensis]|uniref:Putative Holin-X, holin superfamily III n=1 Tax=Nocardioides lianchengensis TaxID=1045774 RepID=A0A1G6VQH4_9ACTN|nr:phage holin family protein [Nocardioides lianchengensis]NYG11257.1 putative membrane protein YqjE [Nocardioides lianchengensis]SDD55683.1 Putative Holin-X, holin superfamily III [Nocardioides lianchengensis]